MLLYGFVTSIVNGMEVVESVITLAVEAVTFVNLAIATRLSVPATFIFRAT
jgi:hypothetical protein